MKVMILEREGERERERVSSTWKRHIRGMINEIGRDLRGPGVSLCATRSPVIDRLGRMEGEGNNGGRFVRVGEHNQTYCRRTDAPHS